MLYDVYLRLWPRADPPSITKPIRVVCISDTHNSTREVPDGDLLIHSGDLTQHGSFEELQGQLTWLSGLPHPHKVVIAGNHDLLLDSDFIARFPLRIPSHSESSAVDLDWGDIVYLQDSSTTLKFHNGRELRIYGSPRTPEFGLWAFQYPVIRDVWTKKIPDSIDVVVVHGPPALHRDIKKQGDGYLLRELRRVKPQLVVFGHVHDGYGQDNLLHDGVQRGWEDIMLQRGELLSVLQMTFWMAMALLKALLGLPQPALTKLINAAVAPGAKDKSKKEPIVLEI